MGQPVEATGSQGFRCPQPGSTNRVICAPVAPERLSAGTTWSQFPGWAKPLVPRDTVIPVRIRQSVSFTFHSQALTPSEITARLGIEPTDFMVRGSRTTEPPRPRFHLWRLKCDEPGLRIDDQIAKVIAHLLPFRTTIAALVRTLASDDPPGGAELQIVRHFDDDEDGEEELESVIHLPNGTDLTRLPGQHQLLGWHLDSVTMGFLQAVGADIDIDEYG
jgi:hypothetical protein